MTGPEIAPMLTLQIKEPLMVQIRKYVFLVERPIMHFVSGIISISLEADQYAYLSTNSS